MKQHVTVLGSTGSIGRQALDVVRSRSDRFTLFAISANSNIDLLIEQARRWRPKYVACRHLLHAADFPEGTVLLCGESAIAELASLDEADIVVNGISGLAALEPLLCALKAGKRVALANKETLVAAGSIVTAAAKRKRVPLLPVDSEHSAIFQCLQGEFGEVEKLLLTASGGPFREFTYEQIQSATKAQALKHPNWSMGAKVTIDSATMMNKGLELMEASWLFGMPAEKIEILVHPQSIVHSMVQFADGAVKAQLGAPDMRVPIQYALSYPQRLSLSAPRVDFAELASLTFFKPDLKKFPALRIAMESFAKGGTMPCSMNGANEVAVAAFLAERIRFRDIPHLIEETLQRCSFVEKPLLQDIFEADREAKRIAEELCSSRFCN